MTSGQITKQILNAAKTSSGAELYHFAKRALSRFPLSSYKILYGRDAEKVTPEAWETLMRAAVDSDREKLARVNEMLVEAGMPADTSFGRFGD
jgi:hypothetical protein